MKKKAFTLIELIAVLVILAILALIVTPLVMNIIRKARISADKRSIDAYGRSIELAIANYLLDNGDFPDSISDLTIEYSGDEVVCSTTQLNEDSNVYLSGCTVGGRNVDYSYGTEKTPAVPTYESYEVGDEVRYNNVDYYVIAESGTSEANVTLLKKNPLTVSEVNQYGTGHVNMYVTSDTNSPYYQQAYDINNDGTVGGMAYYSSSTCTLITGTFSGCTTDYAASEVKYVVDAWKTAAAPAASEARLINIDEVISLGYEWFDNGSTSFWNKTENTPSWLYNSNYFYWTNSQYNDMTSYVWNVANNGSLNSPVVCNERQVVRPVITISKSVLN